MKLLNKNLKRLEINSERELEMLSQAKIEWMVTRWMRAISLIGLVGLLLLACMTVGEVLLRWLFHFPILGVWDISSLLITVSVASCFPLVFAERRSITVKVLGFALGENGDRFLEAFGTLICIITFSLVTWQLWDYADQIAASNQTTMVIFWAVAPWYKIATGLIALCVPVQLIVFAGQLKSVFKRR